MYLPYYMDWSYLILIPAIVLTFWAQAKVKSNFARYAQVRCARGYTGADAARKMLNSNGLDEVQIYAVQGALTDHFDPRNNSVNLSEPVVDEKSISAIAVACHECGHAMQHAEGYALLNFRDKLVPVVNLTSQFSWPMAIIGLILMTSYSYELGNTIFNIGVILFGLVVLFHLVTLPVELNASSRALKQMVDLGIVTDEERAGAKKVLSAAAMTYVAALATALANMLRLLAIRGRRN